ncbi:uncharacterized protein LOC112639649 [Camponotus floridanus]|uniref:uncharacterized protein LOC112639649 n=1 Tax=Camponotus floridanus TaxID=104421 RepID=UPI000DC6948A|nr:uncharacterized protein LOC112639649 [Camponotus floridanus]
MMCLETQHFKLNRFLLLTIGLWPLKQSNLTRFQFIILSSVLTTSIIFQLTIFVTLRCTPNLVVKVLSSTCLFSISAIKYNLFSLKMEAVKDLLIKLQEIHDGLKDKNEIAIMKEYSCLAKRYTAVLTILGLYSSFSIIIALFWSSIFYLILPINISISHHLPIMMEYFIDQEIYFYLIPLHISVAMFIAMTVAIAIGAMFVAYDQHICAMFKISSYRIKRAVHIITLGVNKSKKENLILKGIISAVNIHRQAIKLSEFLVSKIQTMLFCLIIVGVIFLSLNLFRIFQIASSGDDVEEFIFPFQFVTFSIVYMFLANYIAQDLTDHNNHIFTTVYDVQWHIAPLHIQKMILFLLQRGAKDYTINVGGLFVGSLECFATLVKASVSYFTFMYSTQ